jgi:putative redox protein
MTQDEERSIELTRLGKARYQAVNVRGGRLELGSGEDDFFTPVELLLTAIAGCSAIDVDLITSKRSEPVRFELTMSGTKVRDGSGNHLSDLLLSFDVAFPDDEAGAAATTVLPRAVAQSHDRLCTVSRTVELGTPVDVRLESGN